MMINPDTRAPLLVGLAFLVIMTIVFFATRAWHAKKMQQGSNSNH